MKKTFFTVGPTAMHPKLQSLVQETFAKDIPSLSHRGADFQSLYRETADALRRLLNVPSDFHVFFVGSATEAMERVIENCVENKSFHLVNGAFSKRFFQTAEELKKEPEKLEVGLGEGFALSALQLPPATELVCLVQNETSTGVATPMNDVYEFRRRYPDALFAVDIVSSAPYVEIDYSLIDCAFFSVQKGFGMPAGLGVILANERCIEKAQQLQERGFSIGTYHNFLSLAKYESKNQTPATPNVLDIYLLGRIAELYTTYGIAKIRKETDEKARVIYDFFAKRAVYAPFVKKEEWRSRTVIVIETPQGSRPLIEKLKDKGFVIAAGYGEGGETQIRIGNFPMHSLQDVEGLLHALE